VQTQHQWFSPSQHNCFKSHFAGDPSLDVYDRFSSSTSSGTDLLADNWHRFFLLIGCPSHHQKLQCESAERNSAKPHLFFTGLLRGHYTLHAGFPMPIPQIININNTTGTYWLLREEVPQPRPTQPPTLSRMGNEYQPKCGDALRLGS